jgi:stage II sporulation protein D
VRMRVGLALVLVSAAAAAVTGTSPARAGTALVVTGHGWGHGVGMSQWGAYGYALHGWKYGRILNHYYPGTSVGHVNELRVRVLLARGVKVATVGCAARMRVSDGKRLTRGLRAGTYGLGPRLVLPVRRHGTGRSFGRFAVFACARAPLVLDGRTYHGTLSVRSNGRRLWIVNALPLDTYLRGVVPAEMPSRWRLAALEAQAVAARSYAVSELRPDSWYDLLSDTHDQVYGGVAAETPRSDQAVYATRGQVLTWDGQVARTYYSSSSGGRTEAVQDAWPGAAAVPYLRSVSDPYDVYSPHHAWGPFEFVGSQLAGRLGLGSAVESVLVRRGPSWRVDSVLFRLASGSLVSRSGEQVERALHLRSTWFSIGRLQLWTNGTRVLYGRKVALVARAANAKGAVLQQRSPDGAWRTIRHVKGGIATLRLEARRSTAFRLALPGTRGTSVDVAVAPRLSVRPLGPRLLAGSVAPRPDAPVLVWRSERGEWKLVSRPRLDAHGGFRTPLRLHPGAYRVTVSGDGRLTSTQKRLRVTRRLLESLRR